MRRDSRRHVGTLAATTAMVISPLAYADVHAQQRRESNVEIRIVEPQTHKPIPHSFRVKLSNSDRPQDFRRVPIDEKDNGRKIVSLPDDWYVLDAEFRPLDPHDATLREVHGIRRTRQPIELVLEPEPVVTADSASRLADDLAAALNEGADPALIYAVASAALDRNAQSGVISNRRLADIQDQALLRQAQWTESVTVDASATLPTIGRSLQDYARTSPSFESFAGGPVTSGRKNRYNNVQIDGVGTNLNAFSLSWHIERMPMPGVPSFSGRMYTSLDDERRAFNFPQIIGQAPIAGLHLLSHYSNQSDALTSQPLQVDCGCARGKTGFVRDQFHDASLYTGGRIGVVDLLAGVEYNRDGASQPGTDPVAPGNSELTRLYQRAWWNVTSKVSLHQWFDGAFWRRTDTPTIGSPFPTEATYTGTRPAITTVLSRATPAALWQLRVAGAWSPHDRAQQNNRAVDLPWHYDLVSGLARDGSYGFGSFGSNQTTINASVRYPAVRAIYGKHDLGVSARYSRQSERTTWAYPGGAHRYDEAGRPSFSVVRGASQSGAASDEVQATVSDDVTFRRVSITAGVGYHRAHLSSPDIADTNAAGESSGARIPGRGRLFTSNGLSASASGSVSFGDPSMVGASGGIRASWQRLFATVGLTDAATVHPGNSALDIGYFDPRTSAFSDLIATIDPRQQLAVDLTANVPHQDSSSVEANWSPARGRLGVNVSYTHVRTSDLIGWRDIGGMYQSATLLVPDIGTVPILSLVNSTAARRFELTNPTGWFLRSDTVAVTVRKSWRGAGLASVSYVWSKREGLSPATGWKPGVHDFEGIMPFGQDPNDLTNAVGRSPDDRTHVARVTAAWTLPRLRLDVAGAFQHTTGTPFGAFVNVRLPQGTRPILIEPVGARLFHAQHVLDARVGRRLTLARGGTLDLFASIFNILNEDAAFETITGNLLSPNFGRGSRFVEPRRVLVGVRFVR